MSNGRNSEGYQDPTPCEAERNIEYERRQQGRRAKYAGERFENMISAACNYYRSQNIADIEKTPEPMRPLKPYGDRRRGQYVAVFTKKAQNDYKGILNGGRCIAFEAKHTDADKIEASAVSDRQAELLENYEKMGASCFVLVSFKFEQFYRIPWSVWRDMKDIRRGKLARTWTTPKGHATPEAQPRQQVRASRGKSPLARRVGAPTPQRNASEKKNANTGHPAKENKKISIGSSERIFSLRCLRAQKLARLIEKF